MTVRRRFFLTLKIKLLSKDKSEANTPPSDYCAIFNARPLGLTLETRYFAQIVYLCATVYAIFGE